MLGRPVRGKLAFDHAAQKTGGLTVHARRSAPLSLPRGALDVGKSEHHGTALRRDGRTTFDEALSYGEPQLRELVAQTGPVRLGYVDRRNSVLKPSQGGFVAVSPLESVYVDRPGDRPRPRAMSR